MPSKSANGFSMPPPALAQGFEWQPMFDDLLEQTATTNVVDADWSILKDMIKYKLADAIASFLSMGPPWPLAPEDALQARLRAYDTLDSFTGPPFTIQRLCELTLYPRRQYTSLPKYLRALTRVLSVTSERSAFAEDDVSPFDAVAPHEQFDAALGVVSQGVVMSPAHHTHRRSSLSAPGTPIATVRPPPPSSPSPSASSSSSASPRASPAVVPLLSPIPWLRRGSSPSTASPTRTADDVEPLSLSSPTASPHLPTVALPTPSLASAAASGVDAQAGPPAPLQNPPNTTTPTGGLVDEVDPGSGTGETAAPVALSGAMTLSPEKGKGKAGALGLGLGEGLGVATAGEGEEPTSLRERFVRASSPRVEVPDRDPQEEARDRGEKANGREGGGEAMEEDP
ncbi:hypothetical protein JCM10207_002700 [Rhodosporidiobolus poonsookiae]